MIVYTSSPGKRAEIGTLFYSYFSLPTPDKYRIKASSRSLFRRYNESTLVLEARLRAVLARITKPLLQATVRATATRRPK